MTLDSLTAITILNSEKLFWLFLLGASVCFGRSVTGQDVPESNESANPISLEVTPSGSMRYVPGHWGLMESQIRNEGDTQETVRCLAWFDTEPSLQFGREVTLPAQSVRRTWFTVRAPDGDSSIRSMDLSFGQSSVDGSAGAQQTDTRNLVVPRSRPRVLFVTDGDSKEIHAFDLVSAGRTLALPGMLLMSVPSRRLPPVEAAWDIADAVILTGDRIGRDELAKSALMGWVRRGGSLWIPLDLIDPGIVQDLLSDRLQLDVVGRTSLNQIQLKSVNAATQAPVPELVVETPVDLVRVAANGAEVSHTVDGWPAAIHLQYGRGLVTITTVGLGGWIAMPPELVDQSLVTADNSIRFTPAAAELYQTVFGRLQSDPFEPESLEAYVSSRIGYETPPRSIVGWLLGGYVVLALLLMRTLRRLDRSGWILGAVPALSIAAATTLIVLGSMSRSEPPGQQVVQIIESESGRSELTVSGTMAFYSDQDFTPELGTKTGAAFLPDRRGMQNARWRLIRTDLNNWHTEGVQFRPGVRIAHFNSRLPVDRPLRAAGTFNANGFTGRLESPFDIAAEDALVAARTYVTLPVNITDNGTMQSAGNVLPPGEFLNESVVSAEQTRRQDMLRELFRVEGRSSPVVTRPSLLFWAPPLDIQTGELDGAAADGAALFTLPVEIERPDAGARFTVPPPFISYRAVPKADSRAIPAFFSNPLGTWTEYPRAGDITLRFQLPSELLPLEAEGATLTLKISASSRQLLVYGSDLSTPAGDFTSPVGVREVDLEQSQIELTEDGQIDVLLSIGEATDEADSDAPIQDRYWKMDWVQLEFHGRTK